MSKASAAAAAVVVALACGAGADRTTLNVLHIVADDCRPEFGLYGSTNAVTPHLDALAGRSTVFVNAFCQQPVCSPSRNSFMTSLRPDSTGAWNFINYFRQKRPAAVSFPQFFKQQPGYLGLGSGKLYHTTNPPNHDEPASWSPEADGSQDYMEPPWLHCDRGLTFCVNDSMPEREDVRTAQSCVGHLQRAAAEDKGFYVGCGFHRPHAPYVVPSSAFAQLANKSISSAAHPLMDPSVPDVAAIVNFGISIAAGPDKVERWDWDPKTKAVPVDVQLDVRRHYFAAITYMDGLVGELVAEVERLRLTDKTVVIFHADHGYFQGESGEWEKKMLFENTARVPLIIFNPRDPTHRRSEVLAELIDVYPTAVALAGFAVPRYLDGASLAPVITGAVSDAEAMATADGSMSAAFTQYPRCDGGNPDAIAHTTCLEVPETDFSFMGYSVRTSDWRYTEWRRWQSNLTADWAAEPAATELYNTTAHFADSPGNFDVQPVNVAGDPGHAAIKTTLRQTLMAQFDKSPDPIESTEQ